MPKDEKELPSTIERSDEHAQDIYSETLESAEETYGDGERAHRTAYASLKHSYEKVGDHWEPKDQKGPSDEGAERGGPGRHATKGGVDANASKAHLRGRGQEARHRRPVEDEQGRAGRRDPEGEREGDPEGPRVVGPTRRAAPYSSPCRALSSPGSAGRRASRGRWRTASHSDGWDVTASGWPEHDRERQ